MVEIHLSCHNAARQSPIYEIEKERGKKDKFDFITGRDTASQPANGCKSNRTCYRGSD